jgi:hypothetical protein
MSSRDAKTGELIAVTTDQEWQQEQLFELRKINGSLLVLRLLLFGRLDEARKLAEAEKAEGKA